MEKKSASNSKKTESEVSPDKANSGLTLESKRKRKPNSFIYGNDFDTSEVEPTGADKNLSQARPQWRQQWRRAPSSSSIPPNPGLPTTAPMQYIEVTGLSRWMRCSLTLFFVRQIHSFHRAMTTWPVQLLLMRSRRLSTTTKTMPMPLLV